MSWSNNLLEQSVEVQQSLGINLVSQDIEPISHSLLDGFEFEELSVIEQVSGIDLEAEVMPFSSQEVLNSGLVYAPYVPLYTTPTLNTSDLMGNNLNIPGPILNKDVSEEIFTIKKYNDIYSDIKERFELLDL